MDTVHGRSSVTKAEKPPSNQDGGPALQELWSDPTVTSSSSAAAHAPLITKVERPTTSLLGVALLTALYMEMATTTLSSPCGGRRAHVRSVAETELPRLLIGKHLFSAS